MTRRLNQFLRKFNNFLASLFGLFYNKPAKTYKLNCLVVNLKWFVAREDEDDHVAKEEQRSGGDKVGTYILINLECASVYVSTVSGWIRLKVVEIVEISKVGRWTSRFLVSLVE